MDKLAQRNYSFAFFNLASRQVVIRGIIVVKLSG